MPDENRGPHARGLKMSRLGEKEADARRQQHLRNERDVERTSRVACALQSAGIRQRDSDEEAGDAQESKQLSTEPHDRRIAQAEYAKQLIRNQQEERAY